MPHPSSPLAPAARSTRGGETPSPLQTMSCSRCVLRPRTWRNKRRARVLPSCHLRVSCREGVLLLRCRMVTEQISYKDAVLRTTRASSVGQRQPRQPSSPTLQPPRIHLRSEVHRVSHAAPDAEGWRVVRSKRSRRCQAAPRLHHRKPIPLALLGRCFNCLDKGHRKQDCREPIKCWRCHTTRHRSFECSSSYVHGWPHSRVPGIDPKPWQAAVGESTRGPIPVATQDPADTETRRPCNRRHRGGGCGARKRQEDDTLSERSQRSPCPSSPIAERRPPDLLITCFIDRKFDTDQWEAEYEDRAVLLQIIGMRPEVIPEEACLSIVKPFWHYGR